MKGWLLGVSLSSILAGIVILCVIGIHDILVDLEQEDKIYISLCPSEKVAAPRMRKNPKLGSYESGTKGDVYYMRTGNIWRTKNARTGVTLTWLDGEKEARCFTNIYVEVKNE